MVTPTTSATGGYLSPAPIPAPLEGQPLARFLQQLFVGITGLREDMVRPRWQPEPANVPQAGEAWCAMGITSIPGETFAYLDQGQTSARVRRNIELNILASFYDLGINNMALPLAGRLRDGFSVPQNREPLTLAGMGLVEVGEPVQAPVLTKNRWLTRIDVPVVIRQLVERTYSILTLDSANGTLVTDTGLTVNLAVNPPE